MDEKGQYPVNGALICALAICFVFFNQLLFWAVSALVGSDGRIGLAAKLAWGSAAAGLACWLLVVAAQGANRTLSRRDVAVAVLTLAILVSAFRVAPPPLGQMVAANTAVLVWACRGLLRAGSPGRVDQKQSGRPD